MFAFSNEVINLRNSKLTYELNYNIILNWLPGSYKYLKDENLLL